MSTKNIIPSNILGYKITIDLNFLHCPIILKNLKASVDSGSYALQV